MSITISGRVVKRSGRAISVRQVGTHWVRTPRVLRALRPAKAPVPWAGVRYLLTESGKSGTERSRFDAAVTELDVAIGQPGDGVAETLTDVRRRYSIALDEERGTITFTGTVNGDYAVLYALARDTEGPLLWHKGTQAHLPSAIYELVAQVWLSERSVSEQEVSA